MKKTCFFILEKRKIYSLLFMCLCLFLAIFCVGYTGAQSVYFGRANKKVPIYGVQRSDKKVALTFDAAWGADKTREIVDILKSKNCGGTFFLVGFWVEKYPAEVKYIYENGIEIGTHSSTHPHMSKLSEEKIRTELESSMQKITNITNSKVTFFRPPFGDYNDTLISVADSLQLKTIQWSIDSLDWKNLTAQEMLKRVKGRIKQDGGDIVLFHNNSKHIVSALPIIIDYLQSNGYSITGLSDVVYDSNYLINSEGIQIKT